MRIAVDAMGGDHGPGIVVAGVKHALHAPGHERIRELFLVGQQASSSVTDNDLIGRTAQVTVAIMPGTVGQITAKIGDERVERVARAKDGTEIAAGSLVKVESVIGDSVIVVPEGAASPSFLAGGSN